MVNRAHMNAKIPAGFHVTKCPPSEKGKPKQRCTTASKSDALRYIRTVAATNRILAILGRNQEEE